MSRLSKLSGRENRNNIEVVYEGGTGADHASGSSNDDGCSQLSGNLLIQTLGAYIHTYIHTYRTHSIQLGQNARSAQAKPTAQ